MAEILSSKVVCLINNKDDIPFELCYQILDIINRKCGVGCNHTKMILHTKVKTGYRSFEPLSPISLRRSGITNDWLHSKSHNIFFPLFDQMLIWANNHYCKILMFVRKKPRDSRKCRIGLTCTSCHVKNTDIVPLGPFLYCFHLVQPHVDMNWNHRPNRSNRLIGRCGILRRGIVI